MHILDALFALVMALLIAALMQFIVVRQCDTFGKFFYWHTVYQCGIDNMPPEMLHNLTLPELLHYADTQNELTPLERELLTRLTEKAYLHEKSVRKN